jgi:hypothetical protein
MLSSILIQYPVFYFPNAAVVILPHLYSFFFLWKKLIYGYIKYIGYRDFITLSVMLDYNLSLVRGFVRDL